MNKRIILVGPTASGKTFLRKRLEDRGFECDISYTSRPIREGEIDGVHYNFREKKIFEAMIEEGFFYEWVEYNGNYYGTGQEEWDELPLFIMETDGVGHIKPEDRKSCFIMYLDIPEHVRVARLRTERRWDYKRIQDRLATDKKKFGDFKNFDMRITEPEF